MIRLNERKRVTKRVRSLPKADPTGIQYASTTRVPNGALATNGCPLRSPSMLAAREDIVNSTNASLPDVSDTLLAPQWTPMCPDFGDKSI